MVNIASLSAVIAEPSAATPATRGRIEPGTPGAFAKILARGDGAPADTPMTDQESDLPEESGGEGEIETTAAAPADATIAAIPNDALAAAMSEGVGAVLALLAAAPTPAPTPPPAPATPSETTATAILATSASKPSYQPSMMSRGPVAVAPVETSSTAPAPAPAPPPVSPQTPETVPTDTATAAVPAPVSGQNLAPMLSAIRAAFEPAATPTAATPLVAPAIDPATSAPAVPTIAPAEQPIQADPEISTAARALPQGAAASPNAAIVPTEKPVVAEPIVREAASPADSRAVPAPKGDPVQTRPMSDAPPSPGTEPSPVASIPDKPILPVLAEPVAPAKVDPIAPELATTVDRDSARPAAANPPHTPGAPTEKGMALDSPLPAAPKLEPTHRKDDDAPLITVDRAPIDIGIPPTAPAPISTSGIEAAPATIDVAASQSQQSIARHLDLARDNQWLDQLAKDISQAATREGHLKFNLNPEHLGSLQVEIVNSPAGTSVRMTADTDAARAIIADAQPRLVAEARAQGLRITETHVDLGSQAGSGNTSGRQPSSEDHKPFVRTQAVMRDGTGDSPTRADDERYA